MKWPGFQPKTSGAAADPFAPVVLLIHPLGQVWCDAQGQALSEPPEPQRPVVVVADVIEETHVQIDVPAIGGQDRKSFVQLQLESLLPETPFKTLWQSPSTWPWLPKPFPLQAVGVASPALQTAMDEQVALERPVIGVWGLSHLMARWATRQKALAEQPWLLLVFVQAHGLRMVLLQAGIPVFSRLLFDTGTDVQELVQTLKYLQDNRVLEREVQPPVVVLQAPEGLRVALEAQGLVVLTWADPTQPLPTVWPQLVALAQRGAPGQMADPAQRRFYLVRQARAGVRWAGGVVVLGLLWGLYAEAHAVFQRIQQTHQAQEQSVTMSRNAQHIQQTITTSGVDTNLMRLAIEVQRLELSNGIDLLPPAWLLGQLLDPHPQAQLHKLALSLEAQPCGPADPNATAPVPGADGPVLTPEWTFDIWPDESSQPRERQRLLDELAQATRAWPEWTVRLNPVQEAAIAPIAVEQAGGTAPPSAWRWCLVQRTPAAAPADGGGKS